MPSADRIAVAQVGAGYFAQFHAQAWARIDGVALTGICDADEAKARSMAAGVGDPATFSDAAAMLDALEPDLLDIATPPATHAGLIRLAAERGIDVVCQKPFCTSMAEAEAAVLMAEAHGRLIVVHENFRFEPWYRIIRGLIDEGRIGAVYQVSFRLRPGDGQGPNAYLARQPYFQTMPRFLIRETGIHFIDVFRYLLGEPAAVMADLRRLNPVIAGEDAGHFILEYGDGRRALFDGNRLADHAAADTRLTMGEMWIEGSAGTLRLDGEGRVWLREKGQLQEMEVPFAWQKLGYGGDCVFLCLSHVVRHMRDGTPIENAGRDYLANLRIEEAIYRSAAEGRRIALEG
jgi:predicted dehydrogenase